MMQDPNLQYTNMMQDPNLQYTNMGINPNTMNSQHFNQYENNLIGGKKKKNYRIKMKQSRK